MEFLKDLITSISAIIACFAFVLGIAAWKREHIGKRRIELAEDALTLFYEARDAVIRIRSAISKGRTEGESRPSDPGERESIKSIKNESFVSYERYKEESEIFNRLRALKYRFKARFGSDAPFLQLESVIGKIFGAAQTRAFWLIVEEGRTQISQPERQELRKKVSEAEHIMWNLSGPTDPIDKRVDEIVSSMEEICKPIIQDDRGLTAWILV